LDLLLDLIANTPPFVSFAKTFHRELKWSPLWRAQTADHFGSMDHLPTEKKSAFFKNYFLKIKMPIFIF
jgi:hypothetical protein